VKPTARRLLSLSLFLVIVALLGGAAGFAYAHDPQREVLTIALDTEPSIEARDVPLAGTVVEVSNGRLRLDTANGPVDIALPANARIEELRSLPLTGLTPGSVVNVGIERSDSSTAISGIVALEPR
jgi:hypothetical protein